MLKFLKKYKTLILYILIPIIAGFIGNLLGGGNQIYDKINKPFFAPPPILFPIVWTVLYVLMGISAYLVSKEENSKKALTIYYIQLAVNVLWSFFFFRLNVFLFSSIWLLILIILVVYMIYEFLKSNETAAYLQIPYALWVTFAFILNYAIYMLNP